jgi:hypothetical protein
LNCGIDDCVTRCLFKNVSMTPESTPLTAACAPIDPFRAWLRRGLAAALLVVAASAAAQWQVRAVPGASYIGTPVVALRDGQTVIYAARGGADSSGGIVWSGDLGRTWTPQPFVRSDGSLIAPANADVYHILAAPQDGATLYAFRVEPDPLGQPQFEIRCRLVKSTNGGKTWFSQFGLLQACGLILDPGDPLRMYAVDFSLEQFFGTLLKQSVDGGVTWTDVTGIGAQANWAAVAGDGQVYVSSVGGLFVSDGRGGGWQRIFTGAVYFVVAEPWPSGAAAYFIGPGGAYVVRDRVATPLAFPGIQARSFSLVPDFATGTSTLFISHPAGLAVSRPPSTAVTSFDNGIPAGESVYGVARVSSAAYGPAWIAGAEGGLAVCRAACDSGQEPPIVEVIEFHHANLNHYFLTANALEAQQIDAGSAGPGWTRTHRSFRAYRGIEGAPASMGLGQVCRFYGTPGRGPNSHFYTAFASECAGVQQDPGWRLEDPEAFAILVPDAATPCDHPVYRAYNHRAAFNDSNHRYMTERSDYEAMVAAGWSGEGPVFCALP